ncbi:MAG TPA: GNAT family N-acetyltransferase [Candidatus Angelobacter sp.]|nr:GNAT family N-acetyltransferase [Candidatus Angelobacter sp.]
MCTSAQELGVIRPLWERLVASGSYTVFQDFDLNLLASEMFAGREEPFVICAESSHGTAIIPAVIRHRDQTLRLLGEELFDYRSFLHRGDPEALRCALSVLAERGLPLEVVAVREIDPSLNNTVPLIPFCGAPAVRCAEISADDFAVAHPHLARNMRRLERLGFELQRHSGENSQLLRTIYQRKAEQTSESLFHDPVRIEFMVQAARINPDLFEIFTLECDTSPGAALVLFRDQDCRRFYTGWFAPELAKHSPALTLIYEVTRRALAEGLDCDYMTGEQPYKMRLATSAVQLYKARASAEQLKALSIEDLVSAVTQPAA